MARNEERLKSLSTGLSAETGRSVTLLPADLGDRAALTKVEAVLRDDPLARGSVPAPKGWSSRQMGRLNPLITKSDNAFDPSNLSAERGRSPRADIEQKSRIREGGVISMDAAWKARTLWNIKVGESV